MSDDAEEHVVDAIEEAVASFLESARQLKGKHRLQGDELFPPSFVREHTSSENIEDFLRDGDTTAFDSWAEMKDAAKREWMVEQLRSGGGD
jgi:hypothetical protein